jgi:hypothetical protein
MSYDETPDLRIVPASVVCVCVCVCACGWVWVSEGWLEQMQSRLNCTIVNIHLRPCEKADNGQTWSAARLGIATLRISVMQVILTSVNNTLSPNP